MVLPSRQVVDRDPHLREVEGDAADLDAPLREIIVDVAAPQIEAVVGCGNAGRIRVPVQQVQRQRRLTLHVDVDDVGPDQVIGAQQIEGSSHLVTVEIPVPGHVPLDRGNLFLVHEDPSNRRPG